MLSPIFKIQYLGYGFYWAATYVCFQSTVLSGTSEESMGYLNIFFLTSVFIGAVMHITFAILFLKFPKLISKGLSPISISAILALSMCGVALGVMLGPQAYLIIIISAVIHGFSNAWLDVLWFNVFGRINPERSSLYILVSFVVAVVLYYAVLGLAAFSSILGLLLVVAFGISNGVMLHFCFRDLETRKEDSIVARPLRETLSIIFKKLWRPLIGAITFSLVYAFFDRMTSINADHFTEAHAISLFGCVLITVVLLIIMRVRLHKADMSFVSRIALPLLILGCLLVPALGGITDFWSMVLIAIGFTVFDIMIFILIAEMAYEYRLNGAVIEGIIRGIVIAFFGIGGSVGYSVAGWDIDILILIVVAMALINLLIIGGSAILAHRHSEDLDSAALTEDLGETSYPLSDEATEYDMETKIDERVRAFAERFLLTKRETEVLSYLLKGRTLVYISNKLFLSEHTVKTHVRHIYEKTDVHSRQELISIFENLRA